MNEDKIQQQRREHDEASTKQRAAILGVQYLDSRPIENGLPLVENVLSVAEMYKNFMIPLEVSVDGSPYRFGITTQTPQSIIQGMARQYNDRGDNIQFAMISGSAFKAFMRRYDPPKQVIYDDIEIAKDGDSDTLASVSQTLNSVGTDQVFDFLIDQADKLGAFLELNSCLSIN